MNIVLVNPQIPQNTGNIARTCAAAGAALHLVKPLGFSTDDRSLKRAGLDYWHLLDIHYHDNIEEFFSRNGGAKMLFFTTKARRCYTEMEFTEECFLIFGSETEGLPEQLLVSNPEACCRIPMIEDSRSLNLSNAAAIAVYEGLRQTGFSRLKRAGELKNFDWPG